MKTRLIDTLAQQIIDDVNAHSSNLNLLTRGQYLPEIAVMVQIIKCLHHGSNSQATFLAQEWRAEAIENEDASAAASITNVLDMLESVRAIVPNGLESLRMERLIISIMAYLRTWIIQIYNAYKG